MTRLAPHENGPMTADDFEPDELDPFAVAVVHVDCRIFNEGDMGTDDERGVSRGEVEAIRVRSRQHGVDTRWDIP